MCWMVDCMTVRTHARISSSTQRLYCTGTVGSAPNFSRPFAAAALAASAVRCSTPSKRVHALRAPSAPVERGRLQVSVTNYNERRPVRNAPTAALAAAACTVDAGGGGGVRRAATERLKAARTPALSVAKNRAITASEWK